MLKYRVAMSTGGTCTGAILDLPVDFTLLDLSAEVTRVMNNGYEYNFTAEYPYGPYRRFVSQILTIVLMQVL
jgi:hypothetical protein